MAHDHPNVVVLFGATGDLARRKLLPGLAHLSASELAPAIRVVGTSLEEMSDVQFREFARAAVEEFGSHPLTPEQWDSFDDLLRQTIETDFAPLYADLSTKADYEPGEIVDGDAVMAMCATRMKRDGELRRDTVVGTVLGVVVAREVFGWAQALGMGLVLGAVLAGQPAVADVVRRGLARLPRRRAAGWPDALEVSRW